MLLLSYNRSNVNVLFIIDMKWRTQMKKREDLECKFIKAQLLVNRYRLTPI